MLSFVIASATPEAQSNGPGEILQQFGIEPTYLIMQMISFGILAFVLYRFMIKPVISTMDERQRQIDTGLKHAAEMKARLDATQAETMQVLQKAHAEAAGIVEEARRTVKEYTDREHQILMKWAKDFKAKAKQDNELEKERIVEETRGEIARLVVATTQRVLAKELSDFERARFNEAAARELNVV